MFARLALFALTVLVACSGVGGLALSSRLGFCSSVPVWFALAALCDKLRAGAASVGWRCVVRRFAVESRARAANGYRVVGGVGRRPCNRERVRENGAARAAQTGAGGCQGRGQARTQSSALERAHPDENQGPADLQSAAQTTELCTRRLGNVLFHRCRRLGGNSPAPHTTRSESRVLSEMQSAVRAEESTSSSG